MALGRKWKEARFCNWNRKSDRVNANNYITYDSRTSREENCNIYSGNYFRERRLREKMFTEHFNDIQRDAKLTSCMRTEATLDSASISSYTRFLRNKIFYKLHNLLDERAEIC